MSNNALQLNRINMPTNCQKNCQLPSNPIDSEAWILDNSNVTTLYKQHRYEHVASNLKKSCKHVSNFKKQINTLVNRSMYTMTLFFKFELCIHAVRYNFQQGIFECLYSLGVVNYTLFLLVVGRWCKYLKYLCNFFFVVTVFVMYR